MIYNIIVLLFEVLYYSMFMKFARNEGKFWKYLLLFSLITIVLLFVGTYNLYAYLVFVVIALYGLKYIVGTKISLYDLLVIFVMLAVKIIIEGTIYMGIYMFYQNNFVLTMIVTLSKNILILALNKRLFKIYNYFKKIWYNNNFYIRYLFNAFMFFFVILSAVFLLIK